MNALMYICEISASLAESVITLYFLVRYLGYKNSRGIIYTVICFGLLFVDSEFISRIKNFELYSSFLFMAIAFIFTLITLKGKLIEKIFSSLLLFIMLILINLLVVNSIAGLLRFNDIKLLHSGTDLYGLRIIVLFGTKFIYFFALKAILMNRKKVTYSLTLLEWLFITIFFIFSYFICTLLWYINRSHENFNATLYIMIIISLIIMNVMLYWLLQKLARESYRKTEMALMELKLNSQKDLITEIKMQYDEIKTIKHDLQNYIYYPLHLLENNKAVEAKKYLGELYNEKIKPIVPIVFTDNELVDAVINSKIVLCRKHEIDVNYEVVNECFNESQLDISIMLSNMFDNAIDSSLRNNDEKVISLSIRHIKSYLNIIMKNKISTSVLSCNPELVTEKNNKKQHGYGIKSIRKIALKYDGSIKIYECEGYFIVDVLLKNN